STSEKEQNQSKKWQSKSVRGMSPGGKSNSPKQRLSLFESALLLDNSNPNVPVTIASTGNLALSAKIERQTAAIVQRELLSQAHLLSRQSPAANEMRTPFRQQMNLKNQVSAQRPPNQASSVGLQGHPLNLRN